MTEILSKIEIDLSSIDKVKTMVDLLNKYKSELPIELIKSLEEVASSKGFEYNSTGLICGVPSNEVTPYIDKQKVSGVNSINTILKRLTIYPDTYNGKGKPKSENGVLVSEYIYPKNFTLKDKAGNVLIEWG